MSLSERRDETRGLRWGGARLLATSRARLMACIAMRIARARASCTLLACRKALRNLFEGAIPIGLIASSIVSFCEKMKKITSHFRKGLAMLLPYVSCDRSFVLGSREILVGYRRRPSTGYMGRFGGGWQWKLGAQFSMGTLLVGLLIVELRGCRAAPYDGRAGDEKAERTSRSRVEADAHQSRSRRRPLIHMHTLDINAYGREPIESESILAALAEERIVEFKPDGEGGFSVREKCDEFYGGTLTAEQLFELGAELQRLAAQGDGIPADSLRALSELDLVERLAGLDPRSRASVLHEFCGACHRHDPERRCACA